MPAVSVSYVWATPYRTRKKMQLVTQSGRVFTVPVLPTNTGQAGFSVDQQSAPRVGRKPATWIAGQQLRSFDWTMILAGRSGGARHIDPEVSIEDELHLLRDIARSGEKLQIKNAGPSMVGWFTITDCRINATRRNLDNDITVAEVEVTLEEAVSARAFVGPLSGGAFIVAAQAQHPDFAGGSVGVAGAGAGAVSPEGLTPRTSTQHVNDGAWAPTLLDRRGGRMGEEEGTNLSPISVTNRRGGRMAAEEAAAGGSSSVVKYHIVRHDQPWSYIAQIYYGYNSYWRALADYNGYTDQGNPPEGSKVQIPPKEWLER